MFAKFVSMRYCFSLLFIAGFSLAYSNPPASWHLGDGVRWENERAVFDKNRNAEVVLPLTENTNEKLSLRLAPSVGTAVFTIVEDAQETAQFALRKDTLGEALSLQKMQINPDSGKWNIAKSTILTYRPGEKARFVWENLNENQLNPERWHERDLELGFIRRHNTLDAYVDGVLAFSKQVATNVSVQLKIRLSAGDTLAALGGSSWDVSESYYPVSVKPFAAGEEKSESLRIQNKIPFLSINNSSGVDLRKAKWPFARSLPSNYFAAYDSGPMFLHDQRMPTFWAPAQDYSALHLLVRRTDDANKLNPRFSVRVGSMGQGALGGRGQVMQLDYHGEVPEKSGEQVISIPLTEAIGQDLDEAFQFQLNKEIHLSRRSPDPSRFEFRPLGLPAGLQILGATLERSPIQMRLESKEAGNVFEGTKKANFLLALKNITDQPKKFQIEAIATNLAGEETSLQITGAVDPGETKKLPIVLTLTKWGYYDLSVKLVTDSSTLRRKTSFALLPADTRKYRAESPFGTWTYSTPSSPELLGNLLRKAGLRFGMGQFPEQRRQWSIQNNFEVKDIKEAKKYEDWVKKNPDALSVALLMHEHSISADHVSRVPDAFTGRTPYPLSDGEKQRFNALWDDQIAMAKLMREHFPDVHLRLGNGPLPTKEEFLRAGFPAELFDSLGNEAGSFGRLPEAQPPDWVGNNSGIWMDHQLLKTYGYKKPVTQCYEIIYPSTNPGNLSYLDQAAYFVRHGMHSMAWGIPEIRFGLLEDVNNAYRFSNWGSSGMVHAAPQSNPKPAYIAVATMTRILDGARFERMLDTGSASVYGIELINRENQSVYVFWTLRGERDITLSVSGEGWEWTDWQGNSLALKQAGNQLTASISPMPVYLTGYGKIESLQLGRARYKESPPESALLVSKLDDLEQWNVQSEADPLLEYHNPLTPRRLGRFEYKTHAESRSIQVHATKVQGPEAIPMYGALAAKTPIELPGKPTELGVWVDGNSGWGRIIYELEDAKGQKWTSIGASRKGEISEWMLDWLPAEFAQSKNEAATQADWNTNDVFGASAINFDGWNYVRFPLPGNYPGEQNPWPANSQWRFDGDGIVHYPLKLTRLIFELPENVLQLTEFRPVKDQTIRVRDLLVEYETQGKAKQGIHENEL